MRIVFILWLMLFAFGLKAHDAPIANYQFTINREVIMLEVQFDKEDLEKTIQNAYQKPVSRDLLVQYFSFNTNFYINKKETQLDICGYYTDSEHFYLNVELPVDPTPLKELKVFSTCLVKEIENHSNILFIEEEGKELRGFRLHKGRIHTTITF